MSDQPSRGPSEPAEQRVQHSLEEGRLVAELFEALGGEVVVEVSEIFADAALLLPEELPHVERAVEKRVREFATGRVLARRALERLGHPPTAIPVGPDRAAVWPQGVLGTITHTHTLCAVACSTPERSRSLGLDIERVRDMKPGLAERILRPEELETRGGRPTLAYFCAKEAVYKCQHPLSGQFLEFQDVSVAFTPDLSSFEATIHVRGDDCPWKRIPGRLAMTDEHAIAATILRY